MYEEIGLCVEEKQAMRLSENRSEVSSSEARGSGSRRPASGVPPWSGKGKHLLDLD